MLAAAGRKIGKQFSGNEEQKALESVLQRGVVAFLGHAKVTNAELLRESETVLRDFFLHPEVARELSVVLRGESIDTEIVLEILEEIGLHAESLPDLNWERGLSDFKSALLEAAAGEPALQRTLLCNFAIRQLDYLRDISIQLGNLVRLQAPSYLDRYLAYLVQSNRYLRLVGIDIAEVGSKHTDNALDLMNVYITLETPRKRVWTEHDITSAIEAGEALVRLKQPFELSLPPESGFIHRLDLENLEREDVEDWLARSDVSREKVIRSIACRRSVVLVGAAGSGKSTFLRHLVGCLAIDRLLKQAEEHSIESPLKERVQAWLDDAPELTGLTPIFFQAREFGEWLQVEYADHGPEKAAPVFIWEYLRKQLKDQGLENAQEDLVAEAEQGTTILIVDGLDEVQEAHQTLTRAALSAWLDRYPSGQVLMSCRKSAFQHSRIWHSLNLEQVLVAPFSYEQQVYFLFAWRDEFVRKELASPVEANELFGALIGSLKTPTISEFGQNPLLLTLTTIIHTHRGRLPDAEVKLYDDTVSLLLWGWERSKPATTETKLQELLSAAGRTESDLIRTLRNLAFLAHSGLSRRVSAEKARALVASLHPSGSLDWAQSLLELLYYRSGLLVADSVEGWSFPHRRIQEYLAGSHLAANSGTFVEESIQLAYKEEWHDVIVLAAETLIHIWGNLHLPLALVNELFGSQKKVRREDLSSLILMGRVFSSVGVQRAGDTELGKQLLGHVPQTLAQILNSTMISWKGKLPISEALDGLVDPRFDPDFYCLPGDDLLGLVTIPSGRFKMGSPGHKWLEEQEVEDLGEFLISKYPVTTSQFTTFVDKTGHSPRSLESTVGQGNLPATSISWEEAIAYCSWLTETLVEDSRTPAVIHNLIRKGWRLRPPSEAEWERAARGIKGRPYPWGNSFDPSKAAFKRKKLNAKGDVGWVPFRIPVGIIPEGATPEGVFDMCGNIWEWTITRRGTTRAHTEFPYAPYNKDDGREDGISHPSAGRVLKGGSADGLVEQWTFFPTIAIPQYGFRMVLSPRQMKAGTGATHPDATEQDLEIIYINAPDFGDAEGNG